MKKRRDWIDFEELSNEDKKFRIINLSLMILMLVVAISFLLHFIVIGDPNNRIVATISIICFTLLPFVAERILRLRLNNILFLLYLAYLFLAGFLGSVLNFYNISFLNMKSWYDVFIHTFAGYCFCFVGIFLLARVEKYSKLNVWTIAIFAFSFTLAVELVWELMERFADICLGQTAQGIKVDGTNSPLLSDTIVDLLCNFTGGIIFVFHYLIGKKSKFSFGIDFIENEIAYKPFISPAITDKDETNTKDGFKVDVLIVEEKENLRSKGDDKTRSNKKRT